MNTSQLVLQPITIIGKDEPSIFSTNNHGDSTNLSYSKLDEKPNLKKPAITQDFKSKKDL
jgi:hypothetical protein